MESLMAVESKQEFEHQQEHQELAEDITCFPDEVLENVLKFVAGHKDRNSVSVVCKAWYKAEGWSRESVFIGNCYAVSPGIVTRRFPRLKSITLKGKPRFADFSLVPPNWGAFFHPWMPVIVENYPWLEAIRLKRMTVSDESLFMVSQMLPYFRALNLVNCDGFSTDGIAAITSHCRYLQELDLQDCLVDDRGGEWLSYFPDTCTTLVTLNFSCLESDVNFESLEKLVARCRSLKKLNLNKGVTLEQLLRLLVRAPQLTDLGTGTYSQMQNWSQYVELRTALSSCRDLRHLSGFWMVEPIFIPLIYPLAQNLLTLNLSYATIRATEFAKLIQRCPNLEKLWVLDSVEDRGLQTVGETCKNLLELRVFPTDHGGQGSVTEAGLVAVSQGCPKLSSVLYFCKQCTNVAIETVATNCPLLTRFRLCIITPRQRDYVTGETMDEGFGAIVKNCKNLSRLAVSGWLSDRAFEYIGHYAKKLETLSVAFAGESDSAMQHVLRGCPRLRKLEIRDSPFGDSALLSGIHQYESMRFLWMSACKVSLAGCGWLGASLPRLNVEVIREQGPQDELSGMNGDEGGGEFVMECSETVEKLYAYRTLAGCRSDAPGFLASFVEMAEVVEKRSFNPLRLLCKAIPNFRLLGLKRKKELDVALPSEEKEKILVVAEELKAPKVEDAETKVEDIAAKLEDVEAEAPKVEENEFDEVFPIPKRQKTTHRFRSEDDDSDDDLSLRLSLRNDAPRSSRDYHFPRSPTLPRLSPSRDRWSPSRDYSRSPGYTYSRSPSRQRSPSPRFSRRYSRSPSFHRFSRSPTPVFTERRVTERRVRELLSCSSTMELVLDELATRGYKIRKPLLE